MVCSGVDSFTLYGVQWSGFIHSLWCAVECIHSLSMVCSGVVLRRWLPLVAESRPVIDLVVLANHVQVINEQRTNVLLTKELVRSPVSACR